MGVFIFHSGSRQQLKWEGFNMKCEYQWSTLAEHLLPELSVCELEQKAGGVSSVLKMNQWKCFSQGGGGRGRRGEGRLRAAAVPASVSGEMYRQK